VHAGTVRSKARMHVTIGHTTVMADLQFFGLHPVERLQPPQLDPVAAGLQRLSQITQQVRPMCGSVCSPRLKQGMAWACHAMGRGTS
jgi:hypothetical protein